jgi:tetraacyldisaccharide 4'-kinase
MARADAIVLLHPDGAVPEPQTWLAGFTKPILRASLETSAPPPGGKLVAFAGLARPEKFFDTLKAAGADVAEAMPYADHHPYIEDDLDFLTRLAADYDAQLITTEKDAARLPRAWREKVAVLPVSARFHDEAALDVLLAPIRSRMT